MVSQNWNIKPQRSYTFENFFCSTSVRALRVVYDSPPTLSYTLYFFLFYLPNASLCKALIEVHKIVTKISQERHFLKLSFRQRKFLLLIFFHGAFLFYKSEIRGKIIWRLLHSKNCYMIKHSDKMVTRTSKRSRLKMYIKNILFIILRGYKKPKN